MSYLDDDLTAPNAVEYLDTQSSVVGYIKNLKLTTYKEPEIVPVEADSFEIRDGKTAAATVTNNTDAPVTVQLLAAVYNPDGTLISVRLVTKEIAAGGTESAEVTNDTSGTLRAFLWEDQKPLAGSK